MAEAVAVAEEMSGPGRFWFLTALEIDYWCRGEGRLLLDDETDGTETGAFASERE